MAIEIFSGPSLHERMPDVGIELGAACMQSRHASDRATKPGVIGYDIKLTLPSMHIYSPTEETSQFLIRPEFAVNLLTFPILSNPILGNLINTMQVKLKLTITNI